MPNAINIPGKKVWQGSYLAFVPAPLPPELKWTPRLIGALSDADRLVGRLAGQGGRLPNPHILIRPFVQREAVLSSKIEGTQATLGELLARLSDGKDLGGHLVITFDDGYLDNYRNAAPELRRNGLPACFFVGLQD